MVVHVVPMHVARPSSMWATNSTHVAIRTNPWHKYKVNEWNSIHEHDIYLGRNRFEMPRGLSTCADWDRFDGRQKLWGFQSSLFILGNPCRDVELFKYLSERECSKAHGWEEQWRSRKVLFKQEDLNQMNLMEAITFVKWRQIRTGSVSYIEC